jgi:hypothetical protein
MLAKLPLARAVMGVHHDYIMSLGYRGFKNQLES